MRALLNILQISKSFISKTAFIVIKDSLHMIVNLKFVSYKAPLVKQMKIKVKYLKMSCAINCFLKNENKINQF